MSRKKKFFDGPWPERVEREVPHRGPCGLCGGPDARHRIFDAIRDRYTAGDTAEDLAADYGYSLPVIEDIVAEGKARTA